MYIEKEQKGS